MFILTIDIQSVLDHRELSDKQLVNLVGQSNRLAFNELFNRYWDNLYYAAFNVLNDELASEDAVQEVFIDLWLRRNSIKIKNTSAFLNKAIRNQTAKYLRRAKFTSQHKEIFNRILSPLLADHAVNFSELKQHINSSLQKLSPKCREVFELSRFEHLSNKEIAERKKLSIRTVETHISNALRLLRIYLKDAALLMIISNHLT